MSWLTQYFLNPGFVLPGAALASLPIIIHLLSRLRYKKLRFAAMEFLLQSDELNRRRLIIEQLLLLFLRVLAVLLIMFLIARLMLDPSRMMLLRGAATHHVLVLDDSLSMRARVDEEMVFDQAIATLEKMLSQDDGSTASMRVTVLTMTQPDRPLVTDRELNAALLQDLVPRLRNVTCSFTGVSPVPGLTAAENILAADAGAARHVHVITDFRKSDWVNRPEVVAALKSLDAIKAEVSLVQVTRDSVANVVLSQMTSETLAVAVGVPWRLNLTFHNYSDQKSSGLRATAYVDGAALPAKVLIPDIEPGEDAVLSHDIVFESAAHHEIEVRLEDDALLEDNRRFIVADVTASRALLIVDDDGRQDDAGFVAAVFDPQLSGVATQVRTSDVLTTARLDDYDCIYLLNVRELPADATLLLTNYVRGGGGIAWFPGDQATTTWYNTTLRDGDEPLFPVSLGTLQEVEKSAGDQESVFQHPVFEQHPIFAIYNIPDSPFADLVQVSKWYQATLDDASDDSTRPDVKVLARLQNGQPVILEHAIGEGRVLTFLTSAGRRWSNWPISPAAPGFVVMNLLMHQYLQKPSDAVQLREVGEPVQFEWTAGEYSNTIDVFLPEIEGDDSVDTFFRLQAAPVEVAAEEASGKQLDDRLAVSVPQADRPGVYRIKRYPAEGETEETWLALSVPTAESDLTLADASEVQQQGDLGHVRIVSAETAGGLSASDAGREMRWVLIGLLIAVLIGEQLLSLRMSFHAEAKS
jgi:hypothetical protein